MSPIIISFITVLLLFVCILLGIHIGFSLAFLSLLGVYLMSGDLAIALSLLSSSAYESIRDYIYAVLPLFILMGVLMSHSGTAKDLYVTASKLLGRLPGSMGVATVISNAIFAAVTGVSVASAAVFSKISMPEMIRIGYNRVFAVGSVAGSSVLGMLIPPSILLIVYGVLAQVSIGKLFIAGILPGVLLAIIFSVGIIIISIFRPQLVGNIQNLNQEKDNLLELNKLSMLIKVIPILLLILIVLGGIWGGYFTPIEASAVGAFGALIIAIAKGVKNIQFHKTLKETALGATSIMFLLIAAQMYSKMLSLSGLMNWLSKKVLAIDTSPLIIILMCVCLLVVVGCILDSTSILLIMTPLMVPIVADLGFDLIWFGIVMVIAIEMGLLTPPFGMVVFAIQSTLGETITTEEIFKGAIPYLIMMLFALGLIILFPSIATWLPSLM